MTPPLTDAEWLRELANDLGGGSRSRRAMAGWDEFDVVRDLANLNTSKEAE